MKWNRIYRDGVGRFGYEIYEDTTSNKFLVKVFIYESKINISGDYETISRKISEVAEIFNKLQRIFKQEEEKEPL